MEKALRGVIYNAVVRCRELLELDLALQLEGTYGIHADGAAEPLDSLAHLNAIGRADRQAIEAALRHEEATGAGGPQEAVERYLRESAFTLLNRLVALKLMEHPGRALIQPSVGAGDGSKGFQQFSLLSPEAMRAQPDGGYQLYLELLFDDLAHALGSLFDRTLPASILFPSHPCLQQVLGLLNQVELEAAWAEDETIGWVYQFFTPTELRERVRKESSSPRNSYELAFRNQFYTPRYVVSFLADNTLGRLWWGMRSGETRLVKQCTYLIRPTGSATDNISVAKRDPRELRILDPACGSGHFLLYCFDLLLTMYDEAYDDSDLGPALQADYPEHGDYRRDVPRLILTHNLHGIDIDPRACQIAAIALWLRAQRTWAATGVMMRDRPRVKRIQVVCAEPMPGEYDLLGEFCRDLQPAVVGNLVREVWEKMKLAGEAGTLLKIEQEIGQAVRQARERLAALPPAVQLTLFGPQQPVQASLRLDPRDLHDEAFWAEAETRVVEALRAFAQRAGYGPGVARRLFAKDAIQGMAFIDLLQRPFDVMLMNPPFGSSSLGSKEYIKKAYPRTKNDLYAAFVERGLELLREGGYLGAITSRTGLFLTSFRKWREEILLKEAHLIAMADLGNGVLDTAMVETAAYVLCNKHVDPGESTFSRLLKTPNEDKGNRLAAQVTALNHDGAVEEIFFVKPSEFSLIPGSPFAYWSSRAVRQMFAKLPKMQTQHRRVCFGLSTKYDFRFVRTNWEVAVQDLGNVWFSFAKGGPFSKFYCDLHLVIDWEADGKRLKEYSKQRSAELFGKGSWSRWINNWSFYFRPGVCWPRRTGGFSVRALPMGSIFGDKSPTVFVSEDESDRLMILLAIMNSTIFEALVRVQLARTTLAQSYEVGLIQSTPIPNLGLSSKELTNLSEEAHVINREFDRSEEPTHAFCLPALVCNLWERRHLTDESLLEASLVLEAKLLAAEVQLASIQAEIDGIVFDLYELTDADRELVRSEIDDTETGNNDVELEEDTDGEDPTPPEDLLAQAQNLLMWCVGVSFGRWDVRMAQDMSLLPQLQGPFDPLPRCAPGALVATDGLPPATPADIAPEAWLRARENVLDIPAPILSGRELTEPYPLSIAWDSILVDDPSHPRDIVARARAVLGLLWGERAGEIEREACDILGFKTLRDYFRDPRKGFFPFHIKRYSKSRRKAPIYWLLQSEKRNYGIWLYIHRMDKTTLYTVGRNYSDAKVALEESRLEELKSGLERLSGAAHRRREREIERQAKLVAEVTDFRDRLDAIALLNLPSDLNDGVVVSIAPLWELTPWKEAEKHWQKLVAGEYEWSTMSQQMRERGLVKESGSS